MSAVDGYVAGAQREAGDRAYAVALASGCDPRVASDLAADAAAAERDPSMLDFYGASHPEDV